MRKLSFSYFTIRFLGKTESQHSELTGSKAAHVNLITTIVVEKCGNLDIVQTFWRNLLLHLHAGI
jgi:hypothetical protein